MMTSKSNYGKRFYYLPDSSRITDVDEYLKAWHEIIDPLCEALNSSAHKCRVIGFDPGILLDFDGRSVDMSVKLAQVIVLLYKSQGGFDFFQAKLKEEMDHCDRLIRDTLEKDRLIEALKNKYITKDITG